MNLIKEIYLEDDIKCEKYNIRKAARSVAFNDENKIAILNVSRYNYHKLPGGGIEDGEDIYEALRREMLEEVGANIEVTGEIGTIIEYRNKFELLQISYCYKANIVGELMSTNFTDKELSGGFMLEWRTLDEAIEMLKSDKPANYEGEFIIKRDLEFLKALV